MNTRTPFFRALHYLGLLCLVGCSKEAPQFLCLFDESYIGAVSVHGRVAQIRQHPENAKWLTRQTEMGCIGVELAIPATYSKTQDPSATFFDLPRYELVDTPPPKEMEKLDHFRVRLQPLRQWTEFYNEKTPLGELSRGPDTRTTTLFWLAKLDQVEPTNETQDGFDVYETPVKYRKPNYGMRVYLPTQAHSDIYMECQLQTMDAQGVIRDLPVCWVHTRIEGLFELRYGILGQDVPMVRAIDKQIKAKVMSFIAEPQPAKFVALKDASPSDERRPSN